jgi:serine/threonine-protein kinase
MLICLDLRTGTGCNAENPDGARVCQTCGRPLRFALQLHNAGDQISIYRIASVIGHGGFGAVYEARVVPRPDVRVAIKETFDQASIHAFKDEFSVLHELRHPNLPRYFDMFEHEGNGYLVMEFVPGQSLDEVLARRQIPLPESQVLGYAVQICDVLTYLHDQNPSIIHRDLKPANVRITPDGLIKLVDFGLLKQGQEVTRSSRRGLTPAYAPPEQWGGGQSTNSRSDL